MSNLIEQRVVLPASAQDLYAMYLNPRTHAAITGHKVQIGALPGARFRAFDGALTGHILQTVSGCLVVQAWRSEKFLEDDVDSTLILRFTPHGGKGRIDLVHVNVPDHDFQGVTDGWKKYYWKPWRKFLRLLATSGAAL